jgi:hypothetical protein
LGCGGGVVVAVVGGAVVRGWVVAVAVVGGVMEGGCGAVGLWFSGNFYGFAQGLMTSLVAQFD